MEASVRELKAHLSEYLRLVAAGEEVLVTLRGKVVARLAPPVRTPQSAADHEAAAVARLDELPWLSPGNGRRMKGSDRPIRTPANAQTLSELLLEDRE